MATCPDPRRYEPAGSQFRQDWSVTGKNAVLSENFPEQRLHRLPGRLIGSLIVFQVLDAKAAGGIRVCKRVAGAIVSLNVCHPASFSAALKASTRSSGMNAKNCRAR